MKKWKLIVLIIALVALFIGAYVLYNTLSESFSLDVLPDEEGASQKLYPAPDFTVYDFEGNAFKLSDMKGKGVVLNCWASWCPPCKAEMPDFEELYKECGDEIHFMMVNMTDGYQETKEKGRGHVDSKGYTFPVYYDLSNEVSSYYEVTSLPTTFFIDKDGNLITYAKGMITKNTIEKGIGFIK